MKTLVHRDCHLLPKPHIGAMYPYIYSAEYGIEGNLTAKNEKEERHNGWK